MKKLKTFHGNIEYRGASFDISFNAYTYTEASKIAEVSMNQIKKYFSIGINKEINGILVKPYGSRAIFSYNISKEKEYKNIKQLHKVVDKKAKIFWNNFKYNHETIY
jgi:hypothetical protein